MSRHLLLLPCHHYLVNEMREALRLSCKLILGMKEDCHLWEYTQGGERFLTCRSISGEERGFSPVGVYPCRKEVSHLSEYTQGDETFLTWLSIMLS